MKSTSRVDMFSGKHAPVLRCTYQVLTIRDINEEVLTISRYKHENL
jgi:hypothetical protein